MLYLVATPIGNLDDFSPRGVEILKKSSYILCEDTRHSRILLNRFSLKNQLYSFHRWNEKKQENTVIKDLKEGKIISLISDAGTPGICDPGEALVKRCWQEQIPLSAVPGPCAWVTALSLSPFSKEKVQFLGFIPRTDQERRKRLIDAATYRGSSVFYEAPHRLISSLEELSQIDPHREICLMRELTKMYEEHLKGTPSFLLERLALTPPRGEYVVIIDCCRVSFDGLSPQDHVALLQKEFGLEKKEAIALVASLQGLAKKVVYKLNL